jgi:spore maturation protein B
VDKLGSWALPITILLLLLFGIFRKVSIFDTFTEGAKEGLKTSFTILPTLVGLMAAVTMFKASGALDLLSGALKPVTQFLGIPESVTPLILMKPISGSGSTAIFTQILKQQGPNSFSGRVASVLACSTETAFYCVSIYFGAVGIKKTKHTIPAALMGDLTACLIAGLAIRFIFNGSI